MFIRGQVLGPTLVLWAGVVSWCSGLLPGAGMSGWCLELGAVGRAGAGG